MERENLSHNYDISHCELRFYPLGIAQPGIGTNPTGDIWNHRKIT